jgi:hypothetical protein
MQLRYLGALNTMPSSQNSTIVFPFPIELARWFTPPSEKS